LKRAAEGVVVVERHAAEYDRGAAQAEGDE